MERKAVAEEYSLPYFHGALLDEDADKLLRATGDFLIQSKYEPNKTRTKLVLAVKRGAKTRRVEIVRLERGYHIAVISSLYNTSTIRAQS